MPPLSSEDYQTLLQMIAALDTKVYWLEVNADINGLNRNDTTLRLSHSNSQQHANAGLMIASKTSRNLEDAAL